MEAAVKLTEHRRANLVMGMPEPRFREGWIAMLWHTMGRTGRGYKRPMTRSHSGAVSRIDGTVDRRKDKLEPGGRTKLERRLRKPAIHA